ncbi:MAG: tetraacyldisaccharide 4'-kinase [Methyloligellaceae bacterium]
MAPRSQPKAPFWWYGSGTSLTAFLLEPLALVWELATQLRWAVTNPYRSKLPVICVGNLTVGGAGKTPTAIAVAEQLRSNGEAPVFLTRGYGGRIRGPHLVDVHRDSAADVGDEALLLAQTAPVVVSADRANGARLAEAQRSSVIVMDDGFQNPQLEKDFSILVVDRAIGIGNGLIIPAGPMRGSLRFQLLKAQAVILIGAGTAASEVETRARMLELPVFDATVAPKSPTKWLKNKQVIAFAGIAHPEKFFQTAEQAGAQIIERHSFADHHAYTEEDAGGLLADAEKMGALLITTEKDHVRLLETGEARAALKKTARSLPVSLRLKNVKEFSALLTTALSCRQG